MIDKQKAFLFLLEQAPVVRVWVNNQHPGAVLPKSLHPCMAVALDLGLNMPRPIPDLQATEAGIVATLSFEGSPFQVYIPWKNVCVMGVGMPDDAEAEFVWKDDIPRESGMPAPPSAPTARGGLKAV